MTTEKKNALQKQAHAQTQQSVYMPDVDIIEDGDTLTLRADLPGSTQQEVELSVENGVLAIDAKPSLRAPEGYTLAGQEWDYGTFHRTFQLSDAVQVDKIAATMRNGTLTVTIPKREEVKTRKIEIGK
jgi:HSP20 family protein